MSKTRSVFTLGSGAEAHYYDENRIVEIAVVNEHADAKSVNGFDRSYLIYRYLELMVWDTSCSSHRTVRIDDIDQINQILIDITPDRPEARISKPITSEPNRYIEAALY